MHSYNKDGAMRYRHDGAQPVYAPNSFGGPAADPDRYAEPSWEVSGEIVRSAYTKRRDDDDFGQPGTLYRTVMSPSDRDHLVTNIVAHLGGVASHAIVERAIAYWRSVDPELGDRVSVGLGLEPARPVLAAVG